jgi:hypothetical protein
MYLEEKIAIVVSLGLAATDTEQWFSKYQVHRDSASQRGLETELTFQQYLQKALDAGLKAPNEIGRKLGQFVLGRVGDIGNYTDNNVRFITSTQNHKERFENGRNLEGDARRSELMRGQTKETSERLRKVSESKIGRTKESHEHHARQADALAKNFVLYAPDGTEHRGRNVSDFAKAHDLNVFKLYSVLAGKARTHKGWTGHYVG